MVIHEACARGKAVVTTRLGTMPEIVEDGATGLLVPPASPDALGAAMQSLVDDPARAEAMGRCRTRHGRDALHAPSASRRDARRLRPGRRARQPAGGRRVKIAMIGQKGIPALYGGIERHVEEIARRLVVRGHEVSVYCRLHYTPTGGHYHGIELVRLPSINTKHLDTATHVAASTLHSITHDADIVHFHALGPSVFAGIPRMFGKKTVVTVHGLDWQREKWGAAASWVLKQCEGPAVHFPDRTIVVSRTLQKYFAEHHHKPTVAIPNGTVLPDPRPAHRILKFGLEAHKYILFVGRLVPRKGVHFLCEAFSRLDTDMTLALVGGSSGSDDYVAEIRSTRARACACWTTSMARRSRSCGRTPTASCSRRPWKGCRSPCSRRCRTGAAS
jgi:glycosyltransferase involved in cell wall biosynthesis